MCLFLLISIDLVVRVTTTSERESKYAVTRLKVAQAFVTPPFIVIFTSVARTRTDGERCGPLLQTERRNLGFAGQMCLYLYI